MAHSHGRLGAHHLGKVMFKSSQPRPCWAVEALPLRRCEFWCPLRYSNWEILENFIWSCHSCWGQLDTWKIWPFVPKWGGQREGRWEFASHVLRDSFILLWYHTFFQKNNNHFDQESCLSANNMSGNVSLLRMENGGARTCSPAHVVGVSTDDSRAENWALNGIGLAWVDFHKWHQIELIVTKNLSNGGQLVKDFSSKPKAFHFLTINSFPKYCKKKQK